MSCRLDWLGFVSAILLRLGMASTLPDGLQAIRKCETHPETRGRDAAESVPTSHRGTT
ncbi:hypothetical protein ACFPRL_12815 [Pseudoclavibacter helvolus]